MPDEPANIDDCYRFLHKFVGEDICVYQGILVDWREQGHAIDARLFPWFFSTLMHGQGSGVFPTFSDLDRYRDPGINGRSYRMITFQEFKDLVKEK